MQIDEGHIFIFVLVGLGLGVRCICLYAYIKGMDVKWLRLKRRRITRGVHIPPRQDLVSTPS
jgi:hypothetical protein